MRLNRLSLTPNRSYNTTLVILVWSMIGLASPASLTMGHFDRLVNADIGSTLYQFPPEYLALHGAQAGSSSIDITYRNNFIIIACSIPSTLIAR